MQQECAMTLITRVFTSPYATPEGLGKMHTSIVAVQRELVTPCLCRLQTCHSALAIDSTASVETQVRLRTM